MSKMFPKLSILKVKKSQLEFVTKDNFEFLHSLTELDFTENDIEVLPVDVFEELVLLQKLSLDGNKIKSLQLNIFEKNINLVEISINDNNLAKIHENTFGKLVHLNHLFLSKNKLEILESVTFENNTKLEVIDVTSNGLKYIPFDIFEKNTKLNYSMSSFENNECIRDGKLISKEAFEEHILKECKPLLYEELKNFKMQHKECSEAKLSLEEEKKNITTKKDKFEDDLKVCNDRVNEQLPKLIDHSCNFTKVVEAQNLNLNLTYANNLLIDGIKDLSDKLNVKELENNEQSQKVN